MEINKIVKADALEFMAGLSEPVDFILTSPPYFNAAIYNDGRKFADYADYLLFMLEALSNMFRILKPGRFLALNSSPVISARKSRQEASTRHPIPFDLLHRAQLVGFEFLEDIVWAKPGGAAIRRNGAFLQHRQPLAYKPNLVLEYIFVYRKPDGRLIDAQIRDAGAELMADSLVSGDFEQTNLWQIQPETNSKHPAPMPLELARKLVAYYSLKGDLVFDPFMGSGTTALAAWQLGRAYLGCDNELVYVKAANGRLQSADPYQPTRVNEVTDQMPLWGKTDE